MTVDAVQQLLDIEAIKQLKARYCNAVALKDWDTFFSLFAEDLEFVREVYRHFGDAPFGWQACLRECQRRPEWLALNQHLQQKAA